MERLLGWCLKCCKSKKQKDLTTHPQKNRENMSNNSDRSAQNAQASDLDIKSTETRQTLSNRSKDVFASSALPWPKAIDVKQGKWKSRSDLGSRPTSGSIDRNRDSSMKSSRKHFCASTSEGVKPQTPSEQMLLDYRLGNRKRIHTTQAIPNEGLPDEL
jgi:hypothetical protein